jgi:hypothetical protein
MHRCTLNIPLFKKNLRFFFLSLNVFNILILSGSFIEVIITGADNINITFFIINIP